MATKREWNAQAELRALNYMVRVLIVTHSDRAKLSAAMGKYRRLSSKQNEALH